MRIAITLFSLVALAAPAAAQSLADACKAVTQVTVGQWAEYRMTVPQMGDQPIQMRMAIVGEEAKDGKNYYWYEMKMAGTPQGDMIMQMLVPGWPYDESEIAGMIMKQGTEPAVRMSDQMIGMMAQSAAGETSSEDVFKQCSEAQVLGRESVTTPAGTFQTFHIRTEDDADEVWVTKDVPFGLVRTKDSEGSMELLRHGTGAKSSITETPRSM